MEPRNTNRGFCIDFICYDKESRTKSNNGSGLQDHHLATQKAIIFGIIPHHHCAGRHRRYLLSTSCTDKQSTCYYRHSISYGISTTK